MPVAAYQYKSDDGSTYQVVLPSDFAFQMNYIEASGAEPYLPMYVSPRYASYVNVSDGLWMSVVSTNMFGGGIPPLSINVNSKTYMLKSAIGEVRQTNINANVMVIAGPQGPPGSGGGDGAQGPPGPPGPTGPAGSLGAFFSSYVSITLGATGSEAHGLGRVPLITGAIIKCNSADQGFSVNETLCLPVNSPLVGGLCTAVRADGTNLYYRISSSSRQITTVNPTSGSPVSLDEDKFDISFWCS